MTQKDLGKSRGRPRKAETVELAAATIAHVDAQSARVAERIRQRQASVLPVKQTNETWRARKRQAGRLILRAYERAAAAVHSAAEAGGLAGVEAELKRVAYELLRDVDAMKPRPARLTPLDPASAALLRPPAPIGPSTSVLGARARLARLRAHWLELNASIASTAERISTNGE